VDDSLPWCLRTAEANRQSKNQRNERKQFFHSLTLLDDNLFVTYIIIIRPGIRRLLPDFLSLSGAQFRADDKNIVPLPCLFPRAFPPRKIPLSRSSFPGARP
jgi:hypothetical protein